MRVRLRGLGEDGFARAAATMLTGTVIAQAIPMLAAPVLARLYAPSVYGQFALFMLTAYAISALASLRYEMAILNAQTDEEVSSVFALALGVPLLVSLGIAALTPVLQWVYPNESAWYSGTRAHLLGPMVFLQSGFQVFNYLQLRRRQFRGLSMARVARAVAVASINLSLGFMGFVSTGLIWGALLGQLMSTGVLAASVFASGGVSFRGLRLAQVLKAAKRHRDFALFALPADLLSTLSSQFPIVFFDDAARGLFSFTMTILGAPLAFVAGTFHDAFRERAARDYRERGNFSEIFSRLSRLLLAVALPPAALLLGAGPGLFAFAFGEQWRAAGEFARILSVMFAAKLVTSPLSYAYFIVGKQREDFLLHLYIATSTGLALWWGTRAQLTAHTTLMLFAANYFIFYVVFFVRSRSFARGSDGR